MSQSLTPTTITSTSPLNEVDENSLNELFNRDPLELSSQDIHVIVNAMRRQRIAWEQEETSAKKSSKRPSAKLSKENADKIKLEELDLDL